MSEFGISEFWNFVLRRMNVRTQNVKMWNLEFVDVKLEIGKKIVTR